MSNYIKIGKSFLKKKLILDLIVHENYIEIIYDKPSYELGFKNITKLVYYKDIDYKSYDLINYYNLFLSKY